MIVGLTLALLAASSDVTPHRLEAMFTPVDQSLFATAHMRLDGAPPTFELHRELTILHVEVDGRPGVAVAVEQAGPLVRWSVPEIALGDELVVRYVGRLTGEHSAGGSIAGNAIALPPDSGWYPRVAHDVDFLLHLSLPSNWIAIVPGTEAIGDGRWTRVQASDIAAGLPLVAGPFITRATRHGSLRIRVVASDQQQLDLAAAGLLDGVARVMDGLVEVLGPYPIAGLELITALSGDLRPQFDAPGIAFVSPDTRASDPDLYRQLARPWLQHNPGDGNWLDGLVHFLVDHLPAQRRDPLQALARRRAIAERTGTLIARDGEPTTLRHYRATHTEHEQVGGRERGALLFHHLHAVVGDEAFAGALGRLIGRPGVADWNAVRSAFENTAPDPRLVASAFEFWVETSAVAELRLDAATWHAVTTAGSPIELTIDIARSDAIPTQLLVPIRIEQHGAATTTMVSLAHGRSRSHHLLATVPTRVALDPQRMLLRRGLESSPLGAETARDTVVPTPDDDAPREVARRQEEPSVLTTVPPVSATAPVGRVIAVTANSVRPQSPERRAGERAAAIAQDVEAGPRTPTRPPIAVAVPVAVERSMPTSRDPRRHDTRLVATLELRGLGAIDARALPGGRAVELSFDRISLVGAGLTSAAYPALDDRMLPIAVMAPMADRKQEMVEMRARARAAAEAGAGVLVVVQPGRPDTGWSLVASRAAGFDDEEWSVPIVVASAQLLDPFRGLLRDVDSNRAAFQFKGRLTLRQSGQLQIVNEPGDEPTTTRIILNEPDESREPGSPLLR